MGSRFSSAGRSTAPHTRFPAFAWAVLGYTLLVVLWGYFLRISESGDGCGTDWPLCQGAVVPAQAEFPTWVELIHRVSSGGVLLLVVGLAWWAVSVYPRGHAVRKVAILSVVFTVTESLFGAVLVVFGWVAGDVSLGRILIRPVHVVNTFTLMGVLGLTAWWASRGVERVPDLRQRAAVGLGACVIALLALASVGSWTGLAGTAFPVESLGEGLGQYLRPGHLLIYLRTLHPVVAIVALVLLARVVRDTLRGRYAPSGDAPRTEEGSRRPTPTQRNLALGVAGIAVCELLLGPLTIALLHPVGLRLLHLLLADLLWLALLFLASAALRDAAPQAAESTVRTPTGRADDAVYS